MTEKEWGRCKYLFAPFGFFSCTKYGLINENEGYPECKMRECDEIEYS